MNSKLWYLDGKFIYRLKMGNGCVGHTDYKDHHLGHGSFDRLALRVGLRIGWAGSFFNRCEAI